jgi:GntR family transcriptional regulator, transcriptional repressor for pyruvate dehydrogenase complex
VVGQAVPIRRTTVSGEVADRLAGQIRSGEFPAGARLPSERALGAQFGVGRTSVREAMRMLQATGLVTVRPGHGVFVADGSHVAGWPFARWEAHFHYRVEELFEARIAIEPRAAARAAALAEQEDRDALARSLANFEAAIHANDLPKMVLADSDFHDAIMRASRNRLFQAMLSVANHLLIESRRASLSTPGRAPRVLAKHRAIYDAVVAGDGPGAEQAMRAHLLSFASDMQVADPASPEEDG